MLNPFVKEYVDMFW